jgi:hypothetical protein
MRVIAAGLAANPRIKVIVPWATVAVLDAISSKRTGQLPRPG